MQITSGLVYWISRLDGFQSISTILCVVGFAVSFLFFIIYFVSLHDTSDDHNIDLKISKLALKIFIPMCIFGTVVNLFVPSTKEMAAIIIIPKVANSEKIENIGNGMYNLALEWMEELRPSTEKNVENNKEIHNG